MQLCNTRNWQHNCEMDDLNIKYRLILSVGGGPSHHQGVTWLYVVNVELLSTVY